MSKYPSLPILLVDDEEPFLLTAALTLKSAGLDNVVRCSDSREVISLLEKADFSLILMDMIMPHLSGTDLVPIIARDYPHIPLVIVTALLDVETAVLCMKSGAYDYIVKPMDNSRLVSAAKHAVELSEVKSENVRLKSYLLSNKLENPEAFTDIITQSQAMRAVFQYVEAIARTFLPVLVTGETGVGKEKIARAIHDLSGRAGKFVAVNVAGLDDNLFSDTLFGHKKGAFTGADSDRKGLIEQSKDGTLFLDEIGDLSMESQVKMLRLLQEGKYYPLGSDMSKVSNARVVVATNKNLDEMQESGMFRKDLYYRLKSHHVDIPPLRERLEDVPLLIDYFLEIAAQELDKKQPTPPPELYTLLKTYHFPGNIRELEGMIYDAISRHRSGILSLESFRTRFIRPTASQAKRAAPHSKNPVSGPSGISFAERLPTLKDLEHSLIEEALQRAEGNQTIAARLIGMSRKALNNRLIRSRKEE